MEETPRVLVAGAGLAGCEAAWALAEEGIPVLLADSKPGRMSPAHRSANFGELVCSNSLKAARLDSAAGLLKEEMKRLGSVCIPAALESEVEGISRRAFFFGKRAGNFGNADGGGEGHIDVVDLDFADLIENIKPAFV